MKYIALLLISVSLLSCRKRLDSFLFNGSKLESYQLDNYTGEVSLELNGQFAVPDSMINRVHFPVEIDGKTVENADELIVAVRAKQPGDSVKLLLLANGSKRTVTVVLAASSD